MINAAAKNYSVNEIRIKFNKRLEELERMGIDDKLDTLNMRESRKKLLSFLDSVEFKDYHFVILDDDGCYSIRMKNKSRLFIITFEKNRARYYYNNFKNKSNCGYMSLESFFKSKIKKEFYSDFFNIKKKSDGFLCRYIKDKDVSCECANISFDILC